MRAWLAAVGALFVVACGGRVIEQGPAGAGGSYPAGAGGSPALGAGGSWNVGGSPGVVGTGGYFNTGGARVAAAGGSRNTGGTPVIDKDAGRALPVFAAPNVQTVCPGAPEFPILRSIDDFEGTGNVFSPELIWTEADDGHEWITQGRNGSLTESLGPWGSHDAQSKLGLHIQGYIAIKPSPGENIWGATWTFETKQYPGRPTIDISMHKAILLWARLAGPPGKGTILVELPTPATVPKANGGDGSCDVSSSRPCNVHFQAPVYVAQTCWTQFMVLFESMYVPTASAPIVLDRARVFGVDLLISAWTTALEQSWPVDVIVDDIGFY